MKIQKKQRDEYPPQFQAAATKLISPEVFVDKGSREHSDTFGLFRAIFSPCFGSSLILKSFIC